MVYGRSQIPVRMIRTAIHKIETEDLGVAVVEFSGGAWA
jgi:hypothetical protein